MQRKLVKRKSFKAEKKPLAAQKSQNLTKMQGKNTGNLE